MRESWKVQVKKVYKKFGRISNDRRGGRKAAQGKTQAAVGIYLLIQGRL